jgi:uncharacterized protein
MYTFAHVEIPVANLKRAATFYAALFHWKFEPFYGDDYLLIVTPDGQEIGGLTQVSEVPCSDQYFTYVEVGDIERTMQIAESLGGRVVRPKTELPGNYGAYAVVQSPDGYCIGLWTKAAV